MVRINEIIGRVKTFNDIDEEVKIDELNVFIRDGKTILDCHYTLLRNGGYDEDWYTWLVFIDDEINDELILNYKIKLFDFENEIVKEVKQDGFGVWDKPYVKSRKMTEDDDEWDWDIVIEEVEDGMKRLDRILKREEEEREYWRRNGY